jgi:hypothetical protein
MLETISIPYDARDSRFCVNILPFLREMSLSTPTASWLLLATQKQGLDMLSGIQEARKDTP